MLPGSSLASTPPVSSRFCPQLAFFTVFLTFMNTYFKIRFYVFRCVAAVGVYGSVVYAGACGGPKTLDPLELELHMVVSNPV